MTTIYALFWLLYGANIRTIDFILFAYVDALSIGFLSLLYYYDRKGKKKK